MPVSARRDRGAVAEYRRPRPHRRGSMLVRGLERADQHADADSPPGATRSQPPSRQSRWRRSPARTKAPAVLPPWSGQFGKRKPGGKILSTRALKSIRKFLTGIVHRTRLARDLPTAGRCGLPAPAQTPSVSQKPGSTLGFENLGTLAMSRIGGAAYRAGAIAGAIALTAGLAAPAAAQAGNTERVLQTTASNDPQGTRKPVKPNDAAKRTGAAQAVRSGNADAWTINQALPEAPKTVRSNPAPAPEPEGGFAIRPAAAGDRIGRL